MHQFLRRLLHLLPLEPGHLSRAERIGGEDLPPDKLDRKTQICNAPVVGQSHKAYDASQKVWRAAMKVVMMLLVRLRRTQLVITPSIR
jgi:hypothetical protein